MQVIFLCEPEYAISDRGRHVCREYYTFPGHIQMYGIVERDGDWILLRFLTTNMYTIIEDAFQGYDEAF